MVGLSLIIAAAAAGASPAAEPVAPNPGGYAMLTWDSSKYSSEVTECDRQAAHWDDPYKLTTGVSEKKVDLPRAVAACEEAVEADPKNPRLNYQLGRALGYSGLGEKAIPYRKVAVDGDYPQALFVIGYITLFGLNGQPQNSCGAAELLRRSAQYGRFSGEVALATYSLSGRFKGCSEMASADEMLFYLQDAKKNTNGDYFKELLIERLEGDLVEKK